MSGGFDVASACPAAWRLRARRRRHSAAPSLRRSFPARRTVRARARCPRRTAASRRPRPRRCSDRAPSGCGRGARSTCACASNMPGRPWPRRASSCRGRAAAAAYRRPCAQRRPRRRADRVLRHDLVDDAELLRFLGRDVTAGDDHLQRRLRADQPRQPLGAAATRQDADQHFGQADLGGRNGDAVMAGQRVLQAAAERVAVDRGDDRLRAVRPSRRRCARRSAAACGLAEPADVGAGDEAAAVADQHHRLDGRIGVALFERIDDAFGHARRRAR